MLKSLILALLIAAASCAYAEEAPKVSDPAIVAYDKAITDIDNKALTEKRKARDVALKALDSAITKAMKANDLDKAVALKGVKEKIGGEWAVKDLLGDVNPIVGKWTVVINEYKAEWEFLENGMVLSTTGTKEGKWVYEGSSISIKWSQTAWEKITSISANSFRGDSWKGGGILNGTKVK
jgi:hypothetical protein